MRFELHLAPEAEADIDDILEWSVTQFGAAVRDGYEGLIDVAISSILNDPNRTGSHGPHRPWARNPQPAPDVQS